MPILKALSSRTVLTACAIIVAGCGLVFWQLDGDINILYRALIAAYIASAVHSVTTLTPRLIARIQPVVRTSQADFEALAGHIVGAQLNPVLQAFAPLFAAGWLISLITRLTLGAAVSATWHFTFTEALMPVIEVVFSAVMIWRMIHLARLSGRTLDINLFELRGVYPFGELSFAYASVISVRMILQIVLFGPVQGGLMAVIFSLATVASLLALILPIWSVHVQMVAEKIKVLNMLDRELNILTRQLFDTSSTSDISHSAAQVMAVGAMRDRIAARWTWPVPDSVTAVQAIALSSAPTLLTAAKSYLLPVLGLG